MTEKLIKRRRFFNHSFKVMGLLGAGGFLYSAIRFLSPGDMSRNPFIYSPEDSAAGQDKKARFRSRFRANITSIEIDARSIPREGSSILAVGYTPVIVISAGKGYKAFNATCTHLGCLVKWDSLEKVFSCPCHAGRYDSEGNVISGPPPAPLRKCDIQANEGKLKISII